MSSLLPKIAYAAQPQNINELVGRLNKYLINPIIILMFLLAFVYFLWGLFSFIKDSRSPEGRTTGGSHIMWGLIGMAIMFSVFTILNILMGTLNVQGIKVNPGAGEEYVYINYGL
ncbi:hypothetical protein GW765_00710 [Candidatus Parcubacteria bacterium]|nr:hypothetical protein [Candidatus Parcubacteria bacterium]